MDTTAQNTNIPQIPQTQQTPQVTLAKQTFKGIFIKKKLLVGAVLLLIFAGFFLLMRPSNPKPGIKQSIAPLSEGKLVLRTANSLISVGEEVSVEIYLSTGGRNSDGADVILKFNPEFLQLRENDPFEKGDIYNQYLGLNADQVNGILRVSGIITQTNGRFNGTGKFGTVYFKLLKDGPTEVKVDFTKGSTKDSNITELKSAKDILVSTYNLFLGDSSQKLEAKSCASFTQICHDENGNSASQTCFGGKIADDFCIWDPDQTRSCTLCATSTR